MDRYDGTRWDVGRLTDCGPSCSISCRFCAVSLYNGPSSPSVSLVPYTRPAGRPLTDCGHHARPLRPSDHAACSVHSQPCVVSSLFTASLNSQRLQRIDSFCKNPGLSISLASLRGRLIEYKLRPGGCRVAQLVKCLVTSGYPDCSSSGGPSLAEKTGKWKDSDPAVAEHDCPEINSSQRWCLCKKRPCGFEPRRPGQQQVFYL